MQQAWEIYAGQNHISWLGLMGCEVKDVHVYKNIKEGLPRGVCEIFNPACSKMVTYV